MTTTALPRPARRFRVKDLLTSIMLGIVLIGVAAVMLLIATYPAAIGYGGQQAPFWIGMLAAFLVAGYIALAWAAASDFTGTIVGMIIILVLTGGVIGLSIWGTHLGGWDWSQFWLGVAELGLVALASGLVYVHKKFL